MTAGRTYVPEKLPPPAPNYDSDPVWRQKRLTPAQVQVHDIGLGSVGNKDRDILEINTVPPASLVPDHAKYTSSDSLARLQRIARNPIERQQLQRIEEQYGWIRHLRLDGEQVGQTTQCRWTHVSSKFPEYLAAFFWSLSDDEAIHSSLPSSLQRIREATERHKRHSKHGEYFAPFCEYLNDTQRSVLASTPWLDWSVANPPPLRFQIDRREGARSVRSSSHFLRSILQHYYRLEDTSDREKLQVFTKHKPWTSDKDLDLRIRQWYGHYPTSLVVDELWILIVDATNIVTFSSNASWKSRWPPLQLSSRIADVAFRNFRDTFSRAWQDDDKSYDSAAHAITCLSGAIGMLHRSFWPDMPLCVTDRFAGHLEHLQYRLHRAPSTKLVMSLISCYDELNIVIQITQQQMDFLINLQGLEHNTSTRPQQNLVQQRARHANHRPAANGNALSAVTGVDKYRTNITASHASTPLRQTIDHLQRELVDLEDLRDNTNALITRTIQLVNIRLEDNGKAILVFTVVTIVFLPLNFIASFFGMNVSDIRNLDQTQALFWIVAVCVTIGVAAISTLVAFQGGRIMESFKLWQDNRAELKRYAARVHPSPAGNLTSVG